MPQQVRIFIKTALIHLLISVMLGALLLANAALQFSPQIGRFVPVFYHLLMLGWATQLIAGVALWMFPVISRENPRGDERVGWFAYGALNGGLLVRAIAEPLHAAAPQPWWGWLLVIAGILQVVSIWALVLVLWPRVKQRPHPAPRTPPGGS